MPTCTRPTAQVRPEGFASLWLLPFRVSKLWGARQQILKDFSQIHLLTHEKLPHWALKWIHALEIYTGKHSAVRRCFGCERGSLLRRNSLDDSIAFICRERCISAHLPLRAQTSTPSSEAAPNFGNKSSLPTSGGYSLHMWASYTILLHFFKTILILLVLTHGVAMATERPKTLLVWAPRDRARQTRACTNC